MTTALIGNEGNVELRARVALIARGGMRDDVAASVARSGHEVVEFPDWNAFLDAAVESTMDLVLFDGAHADGMPAALSVPSVLVGDDVAGAPASSLGRLPAAAFGAAIEPLLRIANELRLTLGRCRELETLVGGVRTGSALVGRSPVMRRLQSAVSRAADTDATVLVEGPRGAGKSLVARVVHCKSRRSGQAIQTTGCDRLDAESLQRLLEAARNTTLVLEDVERLPAAAQSVLVRHLKERNPARPTPGPRLIATTAAHLPELVAKGAFREDLYYRLHNFPIVVPSLRERAEDVGLIADAVLDAAVLPLGRTHQGFTPSARALLESLHWPGNVGQVETTVMRAHALAGGAPIDREHLLAPPPPAAAPAVRESGGQGRSVDVEPMLDESAIQPFEQEEQAILTRALRATKGNVRRAAQLLGIGRATLYRKIQQYRLRLQ
ncbi:MAG: sigma-54-dependent Fis family transcriptional regulator [Planctomycetes bacterium]|nr:sigma-54-dependent Fis family transcriptional regulator [Planctomycetota bacterium]